MTIQPVELTIIETSPANAWQPTEKNEWADRGEILDDFLRRVRPELFLEKYGRVIVRDPQGAWLDNVKLASHLDNYRCGSCSACRGWPCRPCEKKPPRLFVTVEVDWHRRAVEAEAELAALAAARLALQGERDEARKIVADINNEVFGSQGYFTTPSCVEAVQQLKALANQRYAALTQLRQQLGAFQWQPIETAPKDGTEVLLTDGHYKRTGYWARRANVWSIDFAAGSLNMPTHWLALPARENQS